MRSHLYPLEPLFGRILSPFERFLRRTTAGGVVLIATTLFALVLVAFLGDSAWQHFLEQKIAVTAGNGFRFELALHRVVNDGLMALFFLLVGLELKREIMVGELSSFKDAVLPVAAAAGGMLVPALIYLAFNIGTPAGHGWGVPMATDIAFAIGILVLLAWRVPQGLIVFLTALAIADDLGAVFVIAVFYSSAFNWLALSNAIVIFGVLVLLNRGGIRHPLPYAVFGLLLWFFVLQSGVHATVAGILLAFVIPARPAYSAECFDERLTELHAAFREEAGPETPNDPLRNHRMATIAENVAQAAVTVQSPLQRIEHSLEPWVTFLIIPVFALTNAGIDLTVVDWGTALRQRITLGVFFGLVVGKYVGISLFSWLAVRFGLARLPKGISWSHLLGAACLGGIGFTMSLFIAQLAYTRAEFIEQAKLGILLASLVSALAGLGWLISISRGAPREQDAQ